MAFEDRLKEARLQKGFTQEQIAEKIGVAKSTYTGYEKGNREPNVNTIGILMKELGVDANFLWQDETTFPFELTYDEMENLVKKYRTLDEHGKEMVDFTLLKEWERVSSYTETVTPSPYVVNDDSDYLRPIAAHNSYITDDDEELQNTKDDIAGLKRPD